mgnify:CR=1 FL=1
MTRTGITDAMRAALTNARIPAYRGACIVAFTLARWPGRRTPRGVTPRRILTERQVIALLAVSGISNNAHAEGRA